MGLQTSGIVTTADTTRSTAGLGAVNIRALLKSGTTVGDASADMNLVSVRTRVGGAARTVAILDEDGDWNYDGTAQNTIWDEYDDVVLLSGLRASVISEKEQLGERWQEWLEYARPILERTGVVHYNDDGHHFISTKYLNMLQIDEWTAGCGADAAPYFRVFNPVSQGEKFDPHGDYVRRWCPELAKLPEAWLQRPWEAPDAVRAQAGVELRRTYPQPLVRHAIARDVALEAFARLKLAVR